GHELLEAWKLVCRVPPPGEQRELEPPLVRVVDRLEELLWIGGMDEDGELEARAGVPDGIEVGIVELESRTVRFLDRQSEVLADLAHADRARRDIRLELCDRLLRPPGSDVAEVDPGEHPYAVLR